jgi:hypothetical protein
LHETSLDLANQRLADRLSAFQVLGHEVEGVAVVEEFARVVAGCLRHGLAGEKSLGLIERQARAFDARRVIGLENERSLLHQRDQVC